MMGVGFRGVRGCREIFCRYIGLINDVSRWGFWIGLFVPFGK